MSSHSTDTIHNQVVAMIARHAGVSPESIELDAVIWDRFPPNPGRAEHPAVTSFVRDLHDTFDVYLTEAELAGPTPISLAERIPAKRANPAASKADWERANALRRKGATVSFAIVNLVFVPVGWFATRGSSTRRLLVTLGIGVFLNAVYAFIFWNENRRLRAKRPNGGRRAS